MIHENGVKEVRSSAKGRLLQAALVLILGLWVYSPAFHGEWLMDDDMAITDNADVHHGTGLWAIWFEQNNLDYFPLKDSVQWLQWHLWHLDTFGYHLTNVALHLASAFLLWRLLAQLGVRLAWLGGLIFAIHPQMVESVAWISEIKNTLSLPLLLLAALAYLDYDEHGRWPSYIRSVAFFIASMLCKSSVVMFPVILLLHGWWKHGRIRGKELKSSAAFFAVSLVLGIVTVWFQHTRSMEPSAVTAGSFSTRAIDAVLITAFYLTKAVLPVNLVPVYPKWEIESHILLALFLALVFAIALCWFWTKRRTWGRHALFGFGFFFINLFPVLGFITMAWQSMAWASDHLVYLPLIGLIGLGVAAVGNIYERFDVLRLGVVGTLAVIVGMLAWKCHSYSRIFRSKEAIWSYTILHNPGFWPVAYNNLGLALIQQDRFPEAIQQFQNALRIKPDTSIAHTNWGNALSAQGKFSGAIAQYQAALQIKADDPEVAAEPQYDWGNALSAQGQYDEAISHYEAALQLMPHHGMAHANLGVALIQVGRVMEGIEQYRQALHLLPDNPEIHYNLGIVLGQTGHMPEAVGEFREAVSLAPNDAESRFNLAVALTQTGQYPEAVLQYREALRIRPDYPAARANLAQLQGWGR